MSITTLFQIILKILGLFFLKEIISYLTQIFSTFVLSRVDLLEYLDSKDIFYAVLIMMFWCLICYIFLFKTDAIIKTLKLDQGFSEKNVSINFSQENILSMAIIIIAGILFLTEIKTLTFNLYTIFSMREGRSEFLRPTFVQSFISFFIILLSFLLIGERKRIIAFILKKEQKNSINLAVDKETNEEPTSI